LLRIWRPLLHERLFAFRQEIGPSFAA
jgi:hypothetical protein